MDESAVREHAEAHGAAVASGDLRRAAADLTDEAKASAGAVMAQLPDPVRAADVVAVDASGDEAVAHIRYAGDDKTTMVASRWIEREGRPMIVALEVGETA